MDCKFILSDPKFDAWLEKSLSAISPTSLTFRFLCGNSLRVWTPPAIEKGRRASFSALMCPLISLSMTRLSILRLTRQKAIGFVGCPRRGTLEMKETIARLWPGKEEDLAKRLYRARGTSSEVCFNRLTWSIWSRGEAEAFAWTRPEPTALIGWISKISNPFPIRPCLTILGAKTS